MKDFPTLLYSKIWDNDFKFTNEAEKQMYIEAHKGYKGYIVHRLSKTTKERTTDQNNALHLWYALLCETLNDAGITVQEVLARKIELDWTPILVKEILWKDPQSRLLDKPSTKQLDKVSDIDLIRDHLIRHFAKEFPGIELPPFPHDPNKIR